jgi:hypothetical protein
VREHVRATVIRGDEAEALVSVEPLDSTDSHLSISSMAYNNP